MSKKEKEKPKSPCYSCKGIKKQMNQISIIDLWDTKIQPGLILCAIMGL